VADTMGYAVLPHALQLKVEAALDRIASTH